ncbi:uncharacterized protein LOC114839122 isoform X2 [Esox lucius]|uniref:uncharacterized protein LOC114839122 isoform X2 n=1 Tax=Esox lucius TaxID=8010 RepID=UPI0014774BDB|nr:uncharacterized protein LOC114839122 isoform X2 [Esox lucius]
MEVVTGLVLLMLRGLSDGLESRCDVREVEGQYYGALGGTVYLRLVTDDIENTDINLKKDPSGKSIDLFRRKNKTNFINEAIKSRSEFFINNGTLKISNIERSDAGEYSSETFNSSGISLTCIRFQLSIEEGGNEVATLSRVAVFLVLTVIVAVFWIHWRRTPPQTTDANGSQELEYADITVV